MRLPREQILQMLVAHREGVAVPEIARENNVDPATVRYHVERFEDTYGSTAAVYSLIRPVQQICTHPSAKCLVCGQAWDTIHRRECEEIAQLRIEVQEVTVRLERYEPRSD